MSNVVCMNCGAKNPEHTFRYVAVNVSASSSTSRSGRKQVTTTVTTESVAGAEQFVVCDKCIQSKRRSYAILCGIGGLFAGFFGSLLLAAIGMLIYIRIRVNNRTLDAHLLHGYSKKVEGSSVNLG